MRTSQQAMVGLLNHVAILLVLVNVAAAALTVQQTVENACTGDMVMQCKTTAGKDYGLQTLAPGATFAMTVTSTLDDPDLTCDFSSAVLPDLKVTKTCKIWEYLKSGFTDSPEMSCTAGCLWKSQDDGLYYRAQDGSSVLFIKWADVVPGIPA